MARTPRRVRTPPDHTDRTVIPARRSGPSRLQLGIAAAIAIAVVAGLIVLGNQQSPLPPSASAAGIAVSANVMGAATARVTIEEWADFQCPACRTFATGTEPQLRTAYIATGKVRFVFHHFAFIGPESTWAAEAVECAGEEGRAFDLHDRIYALQRGENAGTFTKLNLLKIAHDVGVSASFDACLAGDRYAQRVRTDMTTGQQKGVTATPTLFINGRKYEGTLTFEQLQAIIDPLLK